MKNLMAIMFLITAFLHSASAQTVPSIQWQRSFGGIDIDVANCVRQTSDGGFVVAGYSQSSGGDVNGNHGGNDYWILKLDQGGNISWQKTLGGSSDDEAYSVRQTTDGGFIVAGWSLSGDGDVSENHGSYDFWIVKLDAEGDMSWQKSAGGSGDDVGIVIQQTADGGFIAAGYSSSDDGDVTANYGETDWWLVRLDTNGNLVWQKNFGGSGTESAQSVEQTFDGGFIIAGYSTSNDGDVTGNHGDYDFWILKIDSLGNSKWQKSLGGSDDDQSCSVLQTSDGNFVVAGKTVSENGDVTLNHGSSDYWILKLDGDGNLLWQKSIGGSGTDHPACMEQTGDGGFIVAGWTGSSNGDVTGNHGNYDYSVVKLDSAGNLIWQQSLGGTAYDEAYSIQQTSDSGFIVAGSSLSNNDDVSGNHGNADYWIVKLRGNLQTGIAGQSKNFIFLYPNPVQGQLTIQMSMPENISIRLYDLHGRVMALPVYFMKGSGMNLLSKAQINTSSLPVGFYTVEITDHKSGKIFTQKFIKEK